MEQKEYAVLFSITGRAWGYVTASSRDEAMLKAKAMDIIMESTGDELIEWEYDSPISAEPNE